MNNKKKHNQKLRIYHRYLGNFLAGIMAIYAVSGIVLIFRDTDFLKGKHLVEKSIAPNINKKELGKILRIRNLKIEKIQGDVLYFQNGNYNQSTGVASYTVMRLPIVLEKLTHLHKAKTGDPLFWLNIFFGLALLFLVISSFWMFRPKSKIFTKGLYFTLAGIALALGMIFF